MANIRPRLDRNQASVLVVDVQERLTPVMWNFAPVEKYCRAMILAGRELRLPVLATEQYPKGLGATLPSLREALGAAPLVKMHFSCGADPEVSKALAATARKQVIVVGIESHVCVFQTVRDLLDQGYQPFVCGDAVTSRLEEHRRILAALSGGEAAAAGRHARESAERAYDVLHDFLKHNPQLV
jgi:nicotinamidase-related amidase